jgi:hypothetical protein
MKKILAGVATGVLAIGVMASSAFASVTYDAATGTGFVGKGDVQTALGYNNAQMQANADNLVFTQESETVYDIVVEWDTNEGKNQKHHRITQKEMTTFSDVISYDAKRKNQVVGFDLTGVETSIVEGENVPNVGDQMNESDNVPKIVTEVTVISHTEGDLKVNGVSLTPPAPV